MKLDVNRFEWTIIILWFILCVVLMVSAAMGLSI